MAALAAVTVDIPVARLALPYEPLPIWDLGISALEYATGIEPWIWITTIALGAAVVVSLALRHRTAHHWLFVAATQLLARNLGAWIKFLTGRLRPFEWLPHPTPTRWLHGGSAFPSGHVVIIAGLALPIAIAFPRARVPALAVAAFVCTARVMVSAHWISDTLSGISLVYLCAALWWWVIFARPQRASRRR